MLDEKMDLSVGPDDQIIEMDIDRLHDFRNHPFKVNADAGMIELKESMDRIKFVNNV